MDSLKPVALITGASSGIGLSTALKLIDLGYIVYGAARRLELMQPIKEAGGHILSLDFYNENSVRECVNSIIRQSGRIDVLINNAGFGLGGNIESVSIQEAKKQFEVNVFGLSLITQLVLPYMRKQKSGRIINISSIAGFFSTPYMGWYHASKYSVEALSDALRMEVKPFGIKVSVIEPGLIQTNWGKIAADHIISATENTDYKNPGQKTADFYKHFYCSKKKITPPEIVTKKIVKAACTKHPKKRYRVGKYSNLFIFTRKILSDTAMDTIISIVYGLNKEL